MKKLLTAAVVATTLMGATAAYALGAHGGINIHWGKGGVSIGGGIHMGMAAVHAHAKNMVDNCKEMGGGHPGCEDAAKIAEMAEKHLQMDMPQEGAN